MNPAIGQKAGLAPADQELVDDLFHALSQPLTALRCSLELALDPRRTAEQCREGAATALEHSEQVAGLCIALRALLTTEEAGEPPQALSACEWLQEMIDDLQPMAESLAVQFCLRCGAATRLCFTPQRLRQGLLALLEYVLNASPENSIVSLDVEESDGYANLHVRTAARPTSRPRKGGSSSPRSDFEQRLRLAMAERIFRAGGGSLWHIGGPDHPVFEVHLPLAPAPSLFRPISR